MCLICLDHHGHGAKRGQASKRKRTAAVKYLTETVGSNLIQDDEPCHTIEYCYIYHIINLSIGFADLGGSQSADMTVPSTSRILRSHSKRSSTRIDKGSGGMSKDLELEENIEDGDELVIYIGGLRYT